LSPNKLLSWEYQLGIRERELNERASTTLGNRASSVRQHISALGSLWVHLGHKTRRPLPSRH
jgi:hypothetical protein